MQSVYKNSKLKYREPTSRKIFIVSNYIFLVAITIISLMPIINILAMSFSNNLAVAANEVKFWPIGFTFDTYFHVVRNVQFYSSFLVSSERVVLGVTTNMIITILVAYPLSKTDTTFRARRFYVWLFMFTMIFNGGVIPTYMMVRYTHIYNSIWSLVLPGAVNVFNMLLLLNFFREIPKEIEESAFMDGAGHFTILLRMYLPLSKAALATLILFSFVNHWNSWFDGLIYIVNQRHYPLQTYLQSIMTIPDISNMSTEERKAFAKLNIRSLKAAQIFIATVPILVVYPFLQQYFTKGIVLGSVKG
jgi:putative aldouronate transport system permease protein